MVAIPLIKTLDVGQEIKDSLTSHGDRRAYELTAPSDGTLVVRLNWERDYPLELHLADSRLAGRIGPMTNRLTVVAAQKYIVSVHDGAPWDIDELLLPFALKATIE